MFRVRKTWEDAASQIGAFNDLGNAKKVVDENPGFYVFDAEGKTVYPVEVAPPVVTPPQNQSGAVNEKLIWDFLKMKGLNDFATAGIMGNLYAESTLLSNILENKYKQLLGHTNDSYTKGVDTGTYTNFVRDSAGYGLVQWTYWSRKENLFNFARSKKTSIGDLGMQLDFFWGEIQGYTSVMNKLRTANSVLDASNAVLLEYEKPADQSEAARNKRAGFGQIYYSKYALITTSAAKTPAEDQKKNDFFKVLINVISSIFKSKK